MGRSPCCTKVGLNRGRWSAEEDEILSHYIQTHGEGSWRSLPKNAGLLRCGKSCRLRWVNYLKSDVKRGNISSEEEELIIKLHSELGNRWSVIASRMPGRTDNEIKNYWNTHLSRKLACVGIDPATHKPFTYYPSSSSSSSRRRARDRALKRTREKQLFRNLIEKQQSTSEPSGSSMDSNHVGSCNTLSNSTTSTESPCDSTLLDIPAMDIDSFDSYGEDMNMDESLMEIMNFLLHGDDHDETINDTQGNLWSDNLWSSHE